MHASRTLDLVPLAKFLKLPYLDQEIYKLFSSQSDTRILHVALYVWTKRRDGPVIELLEKATEHTELN